MMTRRIVISFLVAALGSTLVLSACKSEQKDDDREPAADEQKAAREQDEPADYLEGWKQVEPAELPDAQKPKLARAQQAKRDFGRTLIKTLTEAIGEGDYANAIHVCNTDAPQIAEKVSTEQDLAIGRTSFKLRNPDNAPPRWAEPYVDRKVDEHVILDGPGETVGYLMPIQTGALCVNCHGPADALADGVRPALAEKYPEDQATGFKEGDLRGWFWVRVD
jgi:hypothetical protein